ncbi:MAG: HIRAN domain-containing protein [Bacteroidales bacterium]|nr:HIRAN domain-containing protein [Bacteroidales bacterium]
MKAHSQFFTNCHLAGRKYHDADLVWDDLKVGQTVRLERDEQNYHDAYAIQVIYNKDGEDYLLGYIPRSDNQQLASFFEMGWGDIFECRISKLNPETHPEQQVQLTIRIRRRDEEETTNNTTRKRK